MKTAIYGAGAMGTVLGALLNYGGTEADLIARSVSHVNALNEKGAKIICASDKKEICTPVNACTPDNSGTYDLIFLTTKQRDNTEIATFLKEKLTEDGIVCTIQNGFPEPVLSEVLGEERTYGATCTFGAKFLSDGEAELTSSLSSLSVSVGAYAPNGISAKRQATLENIRRVLHPLNELSGNSNAVKITENLAGARFTKLTLNCAFSGLSVVTGQPFGKIAKNGKSAKLCLAVMRECLLVAKSLGITPEKTHGFDLEKTLCGKGFFKRFLARKILPFTVKSHADAVSGMLLDIKKGKKCEIDYICGVIVRLGEKAGVSTPLNGKIVEITHGIENGLYETAQENLDFFDGTDK